MQRIARRSSPCRQRRLGGAGRIRHLVGLLELALVVRYERRMLIAMDDSALKDIGFNRGDAYAEAHRSFWDVPIDRLRL
jgi:uncharacterized protein YjiS (DUF1127 family)